jgi:aspartate kinase
MKVFKFGGASVKTAQAVRNVANIISKYQDDKIMVVVSAMDKTTNALENLWKSYLQNDNKKIEYYNQIRDFHLEIFNELIIDNKLEFGNKLKEEFEKLKTLIINENKNSDAYNYASIVSFGEIFSTYIVYSFLKENNFNCQWQLAGDYIITDNNYLEAKVDWEKSENKINKELKHDFDNYDIIISQGFIAKSSTGNITTLGREGSDYSASIFAYGLDAEGVYIWKDVPGLLNADPKFFKNTQKLDYISYRETIELAYYGASIIHPKTIQPLQNKNIPLYIKSFKSPDKTGSTIQSKTYADSLIPSYIFKKEQVLISISPKDFSFIAEDNLSYIFNKMTEYGLKVNLMQNSAISFSICMDNKGNNMLDFISDLQHDFVVKYNEEMELWTIRHYNQEIIDNLIGKRKIYLEQKNRTTVQLLVK